MLKALLRTGVTAGIVYGVYVVARKYWGRETDRAVDTAKSTARDVTKSVTSNVAKDNHLSATIGEASHKRAM